MTDRKQGGECNHRKRAHPTWQDKVAGLKRGVPRKDVLQHAGTGRETLSICSLWEIPLEHKAPDSLRPEFCGIAHRGRETSPKAGADRRRHGGTHASRVKSIDIPRDGQEGASDSKERVVVDVCSSVLVYGRRPCAPGYAADVVHGDEYSEAMEATEVPETGRIGSSAAARETYSRSSIAVNPPISRFRVHHCVEAWPHARSEVTSGRHYVAQPFVGRHHNVLRSAQHHKVMYYI